jgi:8-oxo-dGTP pyrophosphatase MutT (NUDIX family)
MNNNWIKLGTIHQYDNPWISVTEDQVINPSGNKGIYGIVHFKNLAIGVIPMDQDGNVYMVGQYRYVTGAYSLEIPEGGGPIGIDPLVSAKRELKEETGLSANHWDKLFEMDLSNSVTDERAIVYLATGLKAGEADPEDTEALTVSKIPFKEVYQMVVEGKITDAITITAILKMKIKFLENEK